ncbi:MAG TPA: LysE family transporter [Candidatus Thermoplasmatota archaeon]|nr:LysE family transporter [Candidatus Thermoplasmatota archaeon]
MDIPFADAPLLAGVLLAWSLAAPPGPANALIAALASQRGFAAGWVAGLGAVTGDLVMFALMGLGALAVLAAVPWLDVGLGGAGAILMAYFAWEAWRSARRPDAPVADLRGGYARSFVTVVTSPFNWAWWVSVGASLFVELGWGIVVGFFAGLVAWTIFWAALARAGAARVARFKEAVAYASAAVLVFFAAVLVVFAVRRAAEMASA